MSKKKETRIKLDEETFNIVKSKAEKMNVKPRDIIKNAIQQCYMDEHDEAKISLQQKYILNQSLINLSNAVNEVVMENPYVNTENIQKEMRVLCRVIL